MWWWDGPGPGKHKPLLLPTEMGRCRLQLKIHSAGADPPIVHASDAEAHENIRISNMNHKQCSVVI